MKWQPIQTAPRQTDILVCSGKLTTIAKLEPITSERGYNEKPMVVFGMGAIFHPTHWMPLPEPPTGEK